MNQNVVYKVLFERAADAVLVADESGHYVDANPAAAAMFGVDREELIGRRVADFVMEFPVELEHHWSTFVRSDGESGRVRIRRADGRIITCEYNATANYVPGRHLSILRDVTATVAAEEERERSKALFRLMLDAVDLLALITDTEGRVVFMNRSMLAGLALELDMVVGRRLTESQPDGDQQHAAFLEAIATETIRPKWENEIRFADGAHHRIRWSSAFIRDANGEIEAVASIGEDITYAAQLEEQVRRAVRMESVGRLAAGIAHDFNNFLTLIHGHVELLTADQELGDAARDHLLQIAIGAERATKLTRQLLTFGRQQPMEPSVVDVDALLARLVDMLAPMLTTRVTVEIESDADTHFVFMDSDKLEQVLVNLAVNARDAMREGGTLRYELAHTDLDGTMADALGVARGRYLEFRVIDTGPGIPPEIMDKVFEPFVTTKPAGEGTGLGLATVHGIIAQSGGAVTVDSSPDRGTTFTIYLPSHGQDGETPSRSTPGTTPVRSSAAGRIVVVDDDHQLGSLVVTVLRGAGYDVEHHDLPLRALESIASNPPALVLTDLAMGGIDGFELTRRVRELTPATPVLVMSGRHIEPTRRSTDPKLDVTNILTKPFAIHELLSSVAAVITRA